MNLRWKIKNPRNRGAITIMVAAASRDHWAPISPSCVNLTRPAVRGLLLVELVIIRGHRNSFQCHVMEESANAVRVGIEGGR